MLLPVSSGNPRYQARIVPFALICLIFFLGGLALPAIAQNQPDVTPDKDVQKHKMPELGFSFDLPANWSVDPQLTRNSRTLYNVKPGRRETPTAFVKIFTEPRLDHSDALKQLEGFSATAGPADKQFLQIGGWPALQVTRVEEQPAPDNAPALEHKELLKIYTYIAAGDRLVTVVASAPTDARSGLVAELQAIGNSLAFPNRGEPAQVQEALDRLQASDGPKDKSSQRLDAERAPARVEVDVTPVDITAEMGANDRINTNGFGELEIATSPDGVNVVVALQSRRWVSSNDGGASFPNGGQVGAGNGDPSVAWGQSGRFYMAWIDNTGNCGSGYLNPVPIPDANGNNLADDAPNGIDCTGIARSDDNGVTFNSNTVNPAVVCITQAPSGPPNLGECFPDQEHIAADRWNAGDTANDDQVYSTWRNFKPGSQDAGLVCSSDSGVTWTAPFDIGTPEVFPRITVGPDGFVYVATYNGPNFRLYKFTSCVSGLNPVPGFPVTVATRDPYQCPFAGHDRCDQNPTSQTVVVDDTDPDHVYYAYADDRGNGATGDSDIFVLDSLDGGKTWGGFGRVARANENVGARRIMPWLCATAGSAAVTWFEQRGGLPTDSTHFFGARVGLDGGGDLVPMEEFILSEVSDNWCDIGWSALTRWGNTDTQLSNAAEACPNQPQLAGQCGDGDSPNNTPDSGNLCDFSDDDGVTFTNCLPAGSSPSGNNERCLTGGGRPKYGDYNGNACAGGKLFAAWASANAPDGLAPPDTATNPGVLFEVINLSDLGVPVITVAGGVHFEDVCPGDSTSYQELRVCNTGSANLQVDVITSDNPDFAVTVPSSGYPVTISPDFCFPFEVAYTPNGGPDSAILTVPSDDPDRPSIEVEADAVIGVAAISTFIANNGSFDQVCAETSKDLNLTIQNNGKCDLQIDSVVLSGANLADFELPSGSLAGTVIEAGNSLQVPVRFDPDVFGDPTPRVASVDVASRTSGGATLTLDQTPVQGTVPPPDIGVLLANDGNFGEVCKGGYADLDMTIFNHGACNLDLTGISLLPDNGSFKLPAGLTLPRVISPDAELTVPVRYEPVVCNDTAEERTILVESDDPDQPEIQVPISGASPCPNLVIDPSALTGLYAFPATVVDVGAALGCFNDQQVVLRNSSDCPLKIDSISSDVPDFSVVAPTQYPVYLPGGEETLAVTVRFTPKSDDDPQLPSEVTGVLSIVSDDPDFPHTADLCGESVTQSGIRTLVTDVTSSVPIMIDSVDSMTVKSKGKNTPSPINLMFDNVAPTMSTVCGNDIYWHLNLERLPATETTGSKGGRSQYEAYAKEGNLQTSRTFPLGQCEFSEFQLQLQSTDGGGGSSCPVGKKGDACDSADDCCSGKCSGKVGAMTCK